jgi:hypothetical protein
VPALPLSLASCFFAKRVYRTRREINNFPSEFLISLND